MMGVDSFTALLGACMKFAVIIGSTRNGRKGPQVANWVLEEARRTDAAKEAGATFELVDLLDFDLPFFDSEIHPANTNKVHSNPQAQRWGDVIDTFDGYIFVTPEYNHSVPAPMKNAFDTLFSEWVHKPVAIASYGQAGGVRAAEHWRAIVKNVRMLDTRSQITVFTDFDFTDGKFIPNPQLTKNLGVFVEELISLTRASKTLQE